MTEQEQQIKLAELGVRFFAVVLNAERQIYLHTNKSVEEWRNDLRSIISEIGTTNDDDGYASLVVHCGVNEKLSALGYFEIGELIADVYEGRIAVTQAIIVDEPSHEEQTDGFGHYGWESA